MDATQPEYSKRNVKYGLLELTTSTQPKLLFVENQTSAAVLELFPSVWSAAENLSSPISSIRHSSLDQLLQINAPRLSPLVAYLLCTRIIDPDPAFRARVVESLAGVLRPDENGDPAPPEVRDHLMIELSRMRQRHIFAILQVAVGHNEMENHVAILLNANPYSGSHLADILADHLCAPALRRLAVDYIGEIGFLDALPTLQRLANRLESRQGGQQTMAFAPTSNTDEAELLPSIKNAISRLIVP